MMTMKTVSEETNKEGDRLAFFLNLGNFLDEFRAAPPEVRAKMLSERPCAMNHPEFLAYAAATAHKLANDSGLAPPAWAFERRCYLPGGRPYFGGRATGRMRLRLMIESPTEFKHRNLFVSSNALVRV